MIRGRVHRVPKQIFDGAQVREEAHKEFRERLGVFLSETRELIGAVLYRRDVPRCITHDASFTNFPSIELVVLTFQMLLEFALFRFHQIGTRKREQHRRRQNWHWSALQMMHTKQTQRVRVERSLHGVVHIVMLGPKLYQEHQVAITLIDIRDDAEHGALVHPVVLDAHIARDARLRVFELDQRHPSLGDELDVAVIAIPQLRGDFAQQLRAFRSTLALLSTRAHPAPLRSARLRFFLFIVPRSILVYLQRNIYIAPRRVKRAHVRPKRRHPHALEPRADHRFKLIHQRLSLRIVLRRRLQRIHYPTQLRV
mmetsp:Transcript_1914/g.7466  ORF Transcript_1914/g.7466 Transcript_1914/m.7466 type:complete len:311 (-) Transcript_1914:306-1238(-)